MKRSRIKIPESVFKRRGRKPEFLKGTILAFPVSIPARFQPELTRRIKLMTQIAEKRVKRLFTDPGYAGSFGDGGAKRGVPVGVALDADEKNIGAQARIAISEIDDEIAKLFDGGELRAAFMPIVEQLDRASVRALDSSIREMSEEFAVDIDKIGADLEQKLAASVNEAVSLFKSIPTDYIQGVERGVYSAIRSGRGLADVEKLLRKEKAKAEGWARRAALDQTKKIYSNFNAHRMEAVGLDEYEWIHTFVAKEPNQHHKKVLNGKVFKLSDPPIIDPRTGTRGKPGDWYNCSCQMRPIFRLAKNNE